MRCLCAFVVSLTVVCCAARADDLSRAVRDSGVQGGVVVHLHCGDGVNTASLRVDDRFLVHGLDTDRTKVAAARDSLQKQGLYGPVTVDWFDGVHLPYADDMVNLIVADSLGDVSREEAMRVLTPLGVLMVGGRKVVKPWPDDIDDWPQYLNNADNNAVARDRKAGPPRRLQWTDMPVWCRSHMGAPTLASVVTGGGRLFSIEDAAPPDNPFLPAQFQIVCRDAFNGKRLWTRPIPRWESITMYIKCQPVQQQRRMAVVGDELYVTLELEGPLSVLDAATGRLLKTYDEPKPVQEVVYADGILYLDVGERFPSAAYNIVKLKGKPFVPGVIPDGPFYGAGFPDGYAPEIRDKEKPVSRIVALDPADGKQLWQTEPLVKYTAASFCVRDGRAVYQTSQGLFCVDAKTGEPLWSVRKPIANPVGHDSLTPGTLPNTVLIADEKVFSVEGKPGAGVASYADNTLRVYSLDDGKLLWEAPARSNYESSSDVFFVDGTVWVGGEHPTQYDADTGRLLKRIVQKMTGPMGHDRCYRNFSTERYFVNSKTGGADFLDLETGNELPNHWTRGGCGTGVLPANGLVYSTPFSCQCSMGAMIQGMNAYASLSEIERSDQPIPVVRKPRLEKGPAYGDVVEATSARSDDWPTYRHDGFRSGITDVELTAELEPQWATKLPSRPSAITVAAGKVFVASVDTDTLFALDAADGSILWRFTAGGRIDSPPTYHRGMVLFGSRDGWVYSVRAADGKLCWRFKDLPDRLIGAYSRLESAWPVPGSVVVVNDTLYFAAGRSSYLDGGIFLYALDPVTGELRNSRQYYGPFDSETGFPVGGDAGFKNDVMVTDGTKLYLRHKAFDLELNETAPDPHIVPTSNFLDGQPQHRTAWCFAGGIVRRNAGDILLADGNVCYEVLGFPIYANHSYFDPRVNGYLLRASQTVTASGKGTGSRADANKGNAGRAKAIRQFRSTVLPQSSTVWEAHIPITGKAMAATQTLIFTAGEPMKFRDHSAATYAAAYAGEFGSRLIAVSAADGKPAGEYAFDADVVWDGLAIAEGRLFIALKDGTVRCLGPR